MTSRHFSRRHCCSLVLSIVVSTSVLCVSAGDEPSKPQSADTFATLFDQLRNDSAEQRDAALKALKAKGGDAVEPALKAALSEPLESGIRAVMLLESLDESKDEKVAVAAEMALKRLMSEGSPAVASRARESLDRHVLQRTIRAARVIRSFNGQIGAMPHTNQRFFANDEDDDSMPLFGLVDRNWKGGAAGLQQFVRADSVRSLYLLKGNPLTREEVAEFHNQHPHIAIVERGAAFIGVGTGIHRFGCMIGTSVENGPAVKAGLRQGDIVVRIGDYPVQSPDDLIRAVGEYKPGDVVRFVYLRDEYHRYQSLFREWEEDPTEFPLLFPNFLLQQMRSEVDVKMEAWALIPWTEPKERAR